MSSPKFKVGDVCFSPNSGVVVARVTHVGIKLYTVEVLERQPGGIFLRNDSEQFTIGYWDDTRTLHNSYLAVQQFDKELEELLNEPE